MRHIVLLLKFSSHSDLAFSHHHIVVVFGVDPSNPLEGERCCDVVYFACVRRAFQYLEAAIGALLFRLVDGLNNDSNSSLIVRIFCIVAVQVSYPLLGHVLLLNPELDEAGDLFDVHELNIIHMTIFLALNHNTWGDALIAHGLGIRLMVFAGFIHLVAYLRRWEAVVAFHVTRVHTLAFQFLILKILVKRYVSSIRYVLFV